MNRLSDHHHRHTIRLPWHDYTHAGGYFVTLVTYKRECLFGEVADGVMRLSALGTVAQEEWFRSAEVRQEIRLYSDEFVVMPNHIHGIIWMVGDVVGATGRSPLRL